MRSKNGESLRTPFVCSFETADLDKAIRYKDEEFSDYFRLSGLTPEHIRGKRILEIGPGMNLGVALELLMAGARQVLCADRFPSLGSPKEQVALYQSIRGKLSDPLKREFDSIITINGDSYTLNPDRLRYLTGAPLETLAEAVPGESFDIILSRAVLEHVFDLDAAMDSMDKMLNPGGYLLHEVDFRDHGMFTTFGLNPFTFLTVSDGTWEKLGSHIGVPNRRLLDFFEAKLSALSYDTRFKVKEMFGSDRALDITELKEGRDYGPKELSMIRSIRPRLLPRFQSLPEGKLLISVVFIRARKPS